MSNTTYNVEINVDKAHGNRNRICVLGAQLFCLKLALSNKGVLDSEIEEYLASIQTELHGIDEYDVSIWDQRLTMTKEKRFVRAFIRDLEYHVFQGNIDGADELIKAEYEMVKEHLSIEDSEKVNPLLDLLEEQKGALVCQITAKVTKLEKEITKLTEERNKYC